MPQSSLWLIPPQDNHPFNKSLKSLISETIQSDFPRVPNDQLSFPPHVTLTSDIAPDAYGSDPQSWLDNLSLPAEFKKERVEPDLNFETIETGSQFFKKLYLRARKDENLLKLAAATRRATGADTDTAKKWAESEFMPHLSLLYADIAEADVKKKIGLVELQLGWEFGSLFDCCGGTLAMGARLVLVDTSNKIRDWKVLASRDCPWVKWTMARGLI